MMWKRILCLLLAGMLLLGFVPGAKAAEVEVAAPSAILMEASTGTVLYEKNAHERLAPASVTKIMTLLLVMEALQSGRISWDDTVIASEQAAAKGGSQIYLEQGEEMSMDEMLKSVVVSSANDCATALAEHVAGSEAAFVELMNRRAGELGMNDTHFVNCTGLDDEPNAAEHLTSAYDIAVMSRELLRHDAIRRYTTIWMDTVRNGEFGLANTNKRGNHGTEDRIYLRRRPLPVGLGPARRGGVYRGGAALCQLVRPVFIRQGPFELRLCQLYPGFGG